ncbi:MAG: ribbon-helix-helix protein, CopG family [bacterium]
MLRTTILADEEILLRLRLLAKRQKKTLSEVIRKALDTYLEQKTGRKKLSFLGAGHSGKKNVSAAAEEIINKNLHTDEGL